MWRPSQIVLGLFLFLLPIQVWNNLVFPCFSGKILFSGWATLALLTLTAFEILHYKPSKIKISNIDLIVILTIVYIFAHFLLLKPVALHPAVKIEMVVLVTTYLLIRNANNKLHTWLFTILGMTAVIQAILGILQYYSILHPYHSQFKITGTFFNPAPFSGYIATLLPVFVISFFQNDCKHNKIVSHYSILLAFCAMSFTLFKSASRAAWISSAISSFYVIILFFKHYKTNSTYFRYCFSKFQNIPNVLTNTGRLLFIIVFVLTVIKLYEVRPDSIKGRILIWKSTIPMIIDNPLTGVGIAQFKANYMHYQANWLSNNSSPDNELLADNTIFAFNELLHITSELGIPGLILFLSSVMVVFYTKSRKTLTVLCAKSGILSLLIFGLFSYPFSILPLKILFVSFIAVIASCSTQIIFEFKVNNAIWDKIRFTHTIVVIIILGSGFFGLKLITKSYLKWGKVHKELIANNYELGLQRCTEIYPTLKTDGFFLAMYGTYLFNTGQTNQAINVLETATIVMPTNNIYLKLGDRYLSDFQLLKAEKAYTYAWQMIPSRIKPVYKLADLYYNTGREDQALCIIEQYLNQNKIKRTMASYEIELELIKLKDQIENNF